MADTACAQPVPERLARRQVRRRRWLSVLAGILIASLYLVVWPRIQEAWFWSGTHTADEIVEFLLERNGIPGAVLAVGESGATPRLRAFGHNGEDAEMQAGERFPIASLSKPLTAAAVMALVEAGAFSLDDRLVDLMPIAAGASDPRYRDITVRHLLQHGAGWEQVFPFPARSDDCSPMALDALDVPLDFAPGERTVYANLGYCWLELIVARYGGSYEGYVRDAILRPAGAGGLKLTNPMLGGAGGWSGPIEDYFRFAARPVHPAQTKPVARLSDPPFDYGLGLVVFDDAVGHWGWLTGGERVFTLFLKRDDGGLAVAFFNDHPSDARKAAAQALDALRRAPLLD